VLLFTVSLCLCPPGQNSGISKNKIKKALRKRFEMKNLGEAKVIIGLEISRDKTLGTLKLSQGKNAAQVLEKCGMAECNPIATPLEVGLQLAKSEKSDESLPYREAVGSLMYRMVGTRPDLAFAVGKISRFVPGYGKERALERDTARENGRFGSCRLRIW